VTPELAKRRPLPKVLLRDFKANATRLLPSSHPLLKILKNIPDEMDLVELNARLPDWVALLEEA
jgi:hypothetical protein